MMSSVPDQEVSLPVKVKIRDARPDDLDALVELLKALFSIEADFKVDETRQRRGLSMMLDGCGKHRCVKVAEVDGRVVGMCTAQTLISTAMGGWGAMVEDMVVAAPYRGEGIGRQLMDALVHWARARGLTRLQLLADRTNFSALDFYDRMGWYPTRLICLRRRWKS
jgi:ribosomal protein S18 acetylase RimI-like enzyme